MKPIPAPHPLIFLFLLTLFVGTAVISQPILPMMTAATADLTNEVAAPLRINGTLAWDKCTNCIGLKTYQWTNWNAYTNAGGKTTSNLTAVAMTLGTNRAAVRAESSNGAFSAWSAIADRVTATNAVGILGLEARTMRTNGAAWSGWLKTTQTWVAPTNFQQQWRPIIVQSNWLMNTRITNWTATNL